MNDLGNCYKNGLGVEQNCQQAVKLYIQAADLGVSEGTYQ